MQRETTPSRRRASAEAAPKPPHLLYVEDNAETRVLVWHLLDRKYEITLAPGFEEAVGAVGSEKSFDLFLLDINLGRGRSGTDLLHEVRGQEEVGEVPAIALTTYASARDRQALLDEGFDAHVAKPFTAKALTRTIEEVLSDQ